jgi:hypothetical protein
VLLGTPTTSSWSGRPMAARRPPCFAPTKPDVVLLDPSMLDLTGSR